MNLRMTDRAKCDLCSAKFDPDPMSSAKGDWDQNSNEDDYGGHCHPARLDPEAISDD